MSTRYFNELHLAVCVIHCIFSGRTILLVAEELLGWTGVDLLLQFGEEFMFENDLANQRCEVDALEALKLVFQFSGLSHPSFSGSRHKVNDLRAYIEWF